MQCDSTTGSWNDNWFQIQLSWGSGRTFSASVIQVCFLSESSKSRPAAGEKMRVGKRRSDETSARPAPTIAWQVWRCPARSAICAYCNHCSRVIWVAVMLLTACEVRRQASDVGMSAKKNTKKMMKNIGQKNGVVWTFLMIFSITTGWSLASSNSAAVTQIMASVGFASRALLSTCSWNEWVCSVSGFRRCGIVGEPFWHCRMSPAWPAPTTDQRCWRTWKRRNFFSLGLRVRPQIIEQVPQKKYIIYPESGNSTLSAQNLKKPLKNWPTQKEWIDLQN